MEWILFEYKATIYYINECIERIYWTNFQWFYEFSQIIANTWTVILCRYKICARKERKIRDGIGHSTWCFLIGGDRRTLSRLYIFAARQWNVIFNGTAVTKVIIGYMKTEQLYIYKVLLLLLLFRKWIVLGQTFLFWKYRKIFHLVRIFALDEN